MYAGSAPVIRLEGPLTLCHDSLLIASGIVLLPVPDAGGSLLPSRSPGGLCVSLVTSAAPGRNARIAAVSPTFGRLYEGTYRWSPGQTWSAPPVHLAMIFQLTSHSPSLGRAISGKVCPMSQNGWHCRGKLLASVSAVSDRNGARRRSEDGRSASRQLTSVGCLERRYRVLPAVSCGATAILSTLVDNHVDNSWSELTIVLQRLSRGIRR